jgi:hypothetical protein
VGSGLRAIARRAGDQQLQHHMVLAEETTDRLVVDIRKHLKGAGDRQADRGRSLKQRAVSRLSRCPRSAHIWWLSGDRTALQGRRDDIVAHGAGEAARPARFEQEAILGCMSDRGLAIGCLVDSRPRGSTLGQAYHI